MCHVQDTTRGTPIKDLRQQRYMLHTSIVNIVLVFVYDDSMDVPCM